MKFENRKSTQKQDSYQARLGEEEKSEEVRHRTSRKPAEKEVNRSIKSCESLAF